MRIWTMPKSREDGDMESTCIPEERLDEDYKRSYSVKEVQEMLGIRRATVYEHIKRQLFQTVRIGHHIRISKNSFDTWLDGGD